MISAGYSLLYKDDQNARWNVKFDGQNLFFQDRGCQSSFNWHSAKNIKIAGYSTNRKSPDLWQEQEEMLGF